MRYLIVVVVVLCVGCATGKGQYKAKAESKVYSNRRYDDYTVVSAEVCYNF